MRIRDTRQGKDIIPNGTIYRIGKPQEWLIIWLEEGYFVELDSEDIGKIINALVENKLIMSGAQL